MKMRGLVSILVKGIRCVSSSNTPPRRYESLERSIPYQAARLVPFTRDSMNWRKLDEMDRSPGDSLGRGRDFRHFRAFLKPPTSGIASSPDLIIPYYIQTLCQTMSLMTEEEAVKRIYSVATRHYFAFGAQVPCQVADLLKALPNVVAVHPDEYVDIQAKRYPWDNFINGQALQYDSKYYPHFSNKELGMTSGETLPNSYGEANNGLGDVMASQETLPNSYGEANNGLGDSMADIPNKEDV